MQNTAKSNAPAFYLIPSRKASFARMAFVPLVGFAFDGQKLYRVMWSKMLFEGQQTLDVKDCPTPVTLRKAKSDRLNCFPSDPIAD